MLLSEVMLVSMASVAPSGLVDIHDIVLQPSSADIQGLCCPPGTETVWKRMICAATERKGQGSFFCTGINDYRLTVENEKHTRLLSQLSFLPLPPPPPKINKKQY